MKDIATVEQTAERILAENPGPVVRVRLLRDVLCRPKDDPDLVAATKDLPASHWVQVLQTEQRADGGWGRFHTHDSSLRQKTGTTEGGVERAFTLGLDASHPILVRATTYITGILGGRIRFPDRAERNDRWATGWRLFAAGKLARIQPNLPILDEFWQLWAELLKRTFASGSYDAEAEIAAHRELTGASVQNSYLVLRSRHHLALLGARVDRLPANLEKAYVDWIWRHPKGIGYIAVPLYRPLRNANRGSVLGRWFTSHQLLSAFPSWARLAGDAVQWLWSNRNEEGLWDFGPQPTALMTMRLSDSWRNKRHRQFDHSTVVLALLSKYYRRRNDE